MQYFDKVVYTFSADNEPTGTIDSGEIVIFRTQDCFSNQMHSESQLVTSCDYSKMNPATGPLFVRDARPGDVIRVELLDVQCDTIGTTTTLPKIGPLWDKCETRTKRIPIEMCLTSNVGTGAVRSYAEHPFPLFYRNHFRVFLCTDNRLMSGTSLTKEMTAACREYGLGIHDLEKITINAMKSAFIHHE